MSILDRLKDAFFPKNTVNVNFSSTPVYSLSGEMVTADSAMKQSVVFSCIKMIAETTAGLNIKVYRTDWLGDREIQTDHILFKLLNFTPNPIQSGYDFKLMLASCLALRNYAYVFVTRDVYGRPTTLVNIDPDLVSVTWDENKENLLYYIGDLGSMNGKVYTKENVIHFRGLHKNLMTPYSPTTYGKSSIGIDQVLSKHTESSFGPNSMKASGVIEFPTPISTDNAKRVMELFKIQNQGAANTGKVMLLDNGGKYNPIDFSSNNMNLQLIQNKEASLMDICRYFNVPPVLVGHAKDSSYSTAEQVLLSYLNFCLKPFLPSICATLSRNLLKEPDIMKYEIAFDHSGLLSGGLEATSSYLTRLVANGLLSPNEGRAILGKDAKDGEEYDALYLQQNMLGVSQISKQQEQNTQQQQETAQLNKLIAEEQIKLFKEI